MKTTPYQKDIIKTLDILHTQQNALRTQYQHLPEAERPSDRVIFIKPSHIRGKITQEKLNSILTTLDRYGYIDLRITRGINQPFGAPDTKAEARKLVAEGVNRFFGQYNPTEEDIDVITHITLTEGKNSLALMIITKDLLTLSTKLKQRHLFEDVATPKTLLNLQTGILSIGQVQIKLKRTYIYYIIKFIIENSPHELHYFDAMNDENILGDPKSDRAYFDACEAFTAMVLGKAGLEKFLISTSTTTQVNPRYL